MASIRSAERNVYEKGTFISLPSGKHINHSFYGVWNTYFAVEDGILNYNHQNGKWLDPITASNGLIQYPALLVWENPSTSDVWIVTPDYIFIYDYLTDWMSRQALPGAPEFSGKYQLGIDDTHVVITAIRANNPTSYSAVFNKKSGSLETWGSDSTLEIDWNTVKRFSNISPELNDLYQSLPLQTLEAGGFDENGSIHLDDYPKRSASVVSTLVGNTGVGEVFLGTYGAGVFYQGIRGGSFKALPFGLLSPDIMCMKAVGGRLITGGRAGLTFLQDYEARYDEAIRNPVYNYSFVSAIDTSGRNLLIAARGGVFKQKASGSAEWVRIISMKDLASERIYSMASGMDGNIMIATERNAYLFHESGLILRTLFAGNLDWPVFDIQYSKGQYILSTYFGLYVFDEATLSFIYRIGSSAEMQSPAAQAAIDPVYESIIVEGILWASTHRGLVKVDMRFNVNNGQLYLAPHAPFKPRGLAAKGGRIWVGSDIGLFSFDMGTFAWRQYTRDEGLISDFVTDLVADRSYIWVGTNLGLTRIKWQNLY